MPKVLITNDDGIDSFMLKVLVEALIAEECELFVVAPAEEHSWIGRAFSRQRTVKANPSSLFDCPTWSIEGTPSDCVNIALGHLLPGLPDLVISGINIGTNITLPLILSSGTIAGAIEGASWGIPSIAFSKQVEDIEALKRNPSGAYIEERESYRCSATHAARLALKRVGKATEGLVVHSVNFPLHTTEETPIRHTEPDVCPFLSLFQPTRQEGTYRFQFNLRDKAIDGNHSDMQCLKEGCISYTVFNFAQLGKLSPSNILQ